MEELKVEKKGYMETWTQTKGEKALIKWLSGLSFAESSFFPVPIDPLLLVMTCIKPNKWARYALIASVTSVLGGIFGYAIGYYFFDLFGQKIVNFYSLQDEFMKVGLLFNQNAFFSIFVSAFTPIPYKIFTIAGGFFKINIFTFIFASIFGRSLRFFIVAFLAKMFGKRYGKLFLKFLDIIMLLLIIVIVLYSLHSFI
jgi:membrane protein YqaA with SNARE-associated domain